MEPTFQWGGVEQMQIKQNKLLKYKFSKYNIRNK